MNRVQQFTHHGAHPLQRCLAVGDQMFEEALYMRVMGFGAQGGHVERLANVAVACLGYPRTLVHAGSRLEMARVKPGELDPLLVGQPGWQQHQFAQQGNGAGIADALNREQQGERLGERRMRQDKRFGFRRKTGYALLQLGDRKLQIAQHRLGRLRAEGERMKLVLLVAALSLVRALMRRENARSSRASLVGRTHG